MIEYNYNYKFMVIQDQRKPYLRGSCDTEIEKDKIEEVDEIKYLDIIIDNKLEFDKFAASVVKKVAKKINFMYRMN